MKRAILYARVSTPRQAELYSLDYQIEQETLYAQDTGLQIITELRDDQSGRKLERDGLEEACQMLEQNEADVLVTWNFDRLHRDYVNSVLMRARLRKAGKELHYAQTKQVSGSTALSRIPEEIQFLFSEVEWEKIKQRTSQGREDAIRKGKRWLATNKPPYGYDKVGTDKTSQMVINEEQAKIIRHIFSWYVYGDEDTHTPLTVAEIISRLNTMGIPTPIESNKGRKHLKLRRPGEWYHGTIYRILHDHSYNGMFYHFRYRRVNGVKMLNTNQDEWVGIPVPRIVEADIFEAAQEKIAQGKSLSRRGSEDRYLMGRRVTCSCGYKMRAARSTKGHTLKDGTEKVYVSKTYRCPGASNNVERIRSCTQKQIKAEELDARVWEWVKEDIGNPVVLERKLREQQDRQKEQNSTKEERLAQTRAHKVKLEEELKALGNLYSNPDMPTRLTDELIAQKAHALKLTEEKEREISKDIEAPLTEEVIQTLLQFSMEFHENLESLEGNLPGQRVVIDGLDVTVTIVNSDGEVHLQMRSILRPLGMTIALSSSNDDTPKCTKFFNGNFSAVIYGSVRLSVTKILL